MKYKVRITKSPNMEYGGQMGYGLDLGGRRVYADSEDSKEDMVSRTLGPVPREEANIEAERGEVYVGDINNDGQNESMVIGGKRHTEGGTPLNVDKGFIFSDTKKMKIKDPEILKMFGMPYKKGGYTPAKIARKYDLNKYRAILENPHADNLSKSTAARMLDNYTNKLGLLSYVHEGQKGFPNGVPDLAASIMPQPKVKYGGYLEQYQSKGQITGGPKDKPQIVNKSDLPGLIADGWTHIGNNIYRKGSSRVEAVDPTITKTSKAVPPKMGPKPPKAIPGGVAGKGWQNFIIGQLQKGVTIDDLVKAGHGTTADLQRFKQYYKPIPGDIQFEETTTCKPGLTFNPKTNKCERIIEDESFITFNNPIIPPPGGGGGDYIPPPSGWTQQDINNFGLAAYNLANIKKYPSVRRDINPALNDFRNMDWRGRAAELQGTYNSQMNTLGTYQSPTSLAANASFMSGQQSENLINRAIDPIEQANVQGYNQVGRERSAILNQALKDSADNQFLRSQDRAVLNQQYDNAQRDARKSLVMTLNQGLTNAAGIYNTNLTESPYYFYNPRTLKMQFNSPNARAEFEAMTRNPSTSDSDITIQAAQFRKQLGEAKLSPEEIQDAMKAFWQQRLGARNSQTSYNYPNNPRNNRVVSRNGLPTGYNDFSNSANTYGGYYPYYP